MFVSCSHHQVRAHLSGVVRVSLLTFDTGAVAGHVLRVRRRHVTCLHPSCRRLVGRSGVVTSYQVVWSSILPQYDYTAVGSALSARLCEHAAGLKHGLASHLLPSRFIYMGCEATADVPHLFEQSLCRREGTALAAPARRISPTSSITPLRHDGQHSGRFPSPPAKRGCFQVRRVRSGGQGRRSR